MGQDCCMERNKEIKVPEEKEKKEEKNDLDQHADHDTARTFESKQLLMEEEESKEIYSDYLEDMKIESKHQADSSARSPDRSASPFDFDEELKSPSKLDSSRISGLDERAFLTDVIAYLNKKMKQKDTGDEAEKLVK